MSGENIQHKNKASNIFEGGEWSEVFYDIPSKKEREMINRRCDKFLRERGEVINFNGNFRYGRSTQDTSTEGVYTNEVDTE